MQNTNIVECREIISKYWEYVKVDTPGGHPENWAAFDKCSQEKKIEKEYAKLI